MYGAWGKGAGHEIAAAAAGKSGPERPGSRLGGDKRDFTLDLGLACRPCTLFGCAPSIHWVTCQIFLQPKEYSMGEEDLEKALRRGIVRDNK